MNLKLLNLIEGYIHEVESEPYKVIHYFESTYNYTPEVVNSKTLRFDIRYLARLVRTMKDIMGYKLIKQIGNVAHFERKDKRLTRMTVEKKGFNRVELEFDVPRSEVILVEPIAPHEPTVFDFSTWKSSEDDGD